MGGMGWKWVYFIFIFIFLEIGGKPDIRGGWRDWTGLDGIIYFAFFVNYSLTTAD